MGDHLKNFYELHKEQLNLFNAQDPSAGDFDVIFLIGEQKLYAHKSKLTDVSNTFDTMLSERWTSPNQPIKIETFSFNDFKQFITFIYSGDCTLNHDNIFTMIDLVEFYNVKVFKKICEDFLLKIVWDLEKVYQMLELAYKYSMENLKKSLLDFVSKTFLAFIKSEKFQSLEKSMVEDIVESNKNTVRQEEFFEMMYKWAENHALTEQILNEDLNLNELIKIELSPFLPCFKFNFMNTKFLYEFVVKRSFLFTGTELSEILLSAQYLICLDINGTLLKGVLNCPDIDKVFHTFQSQKYASGSSFIDRTWADFDRESKPMPIKFTEPSKLTKNERTEWYLVYYFFTHQAYGFLVKHQSELNSSDYLLAELIAEGEFRRGSTCTIN